MTEKEQLHGSERLPHPRMWQPLDSGDFLEEHTILTLFEEQVKMHPEKPLLFFRDQVLSYGHLDRCATALGQRLRDMGIGREDRVAIIAQRSVEMVVAVYGVLKSGAAYVPIDASYPPDRISYILADAEPKAIVLYKAELMTHIPKVELDNVLELQPTDTALPKGEGKDLAYLIYTSGTSGKPKGVMIEHRNVVNYSIQKGEGVLRYLREGMGDTIVSLTNFVFDIFVTELLMAPMLGMTVVLADDREQVDAGALLELMEKHPAAIMQTTPSRVQLYLSQPRGEDCLKGFSYMMLGGEAVSAQLVQRLHRINPRARIVDVYGPSETTVWSTCADVTQGDVTVGTPITNTEVYILDGMKLCPVGVSGELCIGGMGVARGYLNRPELTEEKFIPNPFGQGRIYRTGDLAQWRADGNLEFLGRMDDQVKIRGTRIELGEIDAVLRQIPDVKDCAVIARAEEGGQKELYAFLTSDAELNFHSIRDRMGEFLPECMIPAYFAQIDSIPLNANGKLDKRALPTVAQRLSQSYAEPVTENEKRLCLMFEEILGTQPVGREDNFFDLGGHSFRLIRLRNRIAEEFGCDLSQREIFANPRPADLGALLEESVGRRGIPLTAHPEITELPASPSQRGLYYDHVLRGDDYSYHLPSAYRLTKDLDVEAFRQAFSALIRRYEILRTVFVEEKDLPYQKILPFEAVDLTLSDDPYTDVDTMIRQWIEPFDLSQGPLIRGRLVARQEEWLFLLDMHHIICDGISRDILLTELARLYEGKCLAMPELQYKDHCIRLSQWDLNDMRKVWRQQYESLPPPLELPTDYPRTPGKKRRGELISLPLPTELSKGIRSFARTQGVSEYMLFLSAAFLLLSRHSGQEDLVIGSAFSGRIDTATENMPGMFAATLPLRAYPEQGKTYKAFLQEIKALSLCGQENQEYPFETLIQDLNIPGEVGRNPLFDVMLVMQNGDQAAYTEGALELQLLKEFYFGATFDLTFNIEEMGNDFTLSLQYSKELFTEETARLYLQHFCNLLESILRRPEASLAELSMISSEEETLLEAFRGDSAEYDSTATISQLLEEQVSRDPQATAIVCGKHSISYGELGRRVHALAYRLRQEGVEPNVPVALLIPQSIQRFVAIYAVLHAGGAYVPIDPNYPEERIAYILSDSGAKLLLTLDSTQAWDIPCIDVGDERLYEGQHPSLPPVPGPRDLAYCIYTSGTAGKPKGVMVEHQGVSNLKHYFETVLHITPSDRILQFANYVFDGSVWEMNMALLTGARLILVTDRRDLPQIRATMEREGVTVASFPPNLYAQLGDISPTILVTAGSASDLGIVEKASHCRYINSYGPTECTVAVTHWEGRTDRAFVPIGKPIPNKRVYILRGDQPCAFGVPGEICVGGVGLARGYLGQEELTEKHFVPNPFGEGRLYRTGDKGLLLPDGNIRFLGRMDDQVKIRGYRVEPGEIEACLRVLPHVRDCTVVVRRDASMEAALFAYVVTEGKIGFDALRKELRKQLPEYMIPSYFMELEEIPVTVNGKVDKNRLPQISIRSDSEYIAPRNAKEEALAEAIEEIMAPHSVSMKDSFFELGGDSIKAIRIVSHLRERNLSLAVSDIMTGAAVEEIALYIEDLSENTYDQGQHTGPVTDTPMLRMFRHWNLAKPQHFNQAVILPMEGSVDALRYALNALTEHHDILRSVYRDGKQEILPYMENRHFALTTYTVPWDAEARAWIAERCEEVQASMELPEGPLVKACLFDTGRERVLLLAIHHLLVDSVSWHILLEDLDSGMEAYAEGRALELPLKTASFQQWATALEDYAASGELRKEQGYWDSVFQGLSRGKLRKGVFGGSDRREAYFSLTEEQTQALLTEACNTYHTQVADLLLAAMAMAVRQYSGQSQVALCLEGHGRETIHVPMDIDRTVGWFTCAYPVLLPCDAQVSEAIIETKELLRKIPNHGLGFGLLYPPSALDDIDIYFNYVGQSEEGAEGTYHPGATCDKDNEVGGPINFNGGISKGKLSFHITSGRGWNQSFDLGELAEEYHRQLLAVLDHCLSSEESYRTYADIDAQDLEEEDFDEIAALLGLT